MEGGATAMSATFHNRTKIKASDFPARIAMSLYGKSDDPEHEDNRGNREFLDGYAAGLVHDSGGALDGIADEWARRGSPEVLPSGFLSWKRGFNCGAMRRTWERVQKEEERKLTW